MDVVYAVLRDVCTVNGAARRCAVERGRRRSRTQVLTASGETVPCSVTAVFRVKGAPVVGDTLVVDGATCRVVSVSVRDTQGPWMRHALVDAATRDDILGGPVATPITVIPQSVTVDEYGTRRRTPDDTAALDTLGRIDVSSSGEDTSDGQRSTVDAVLTIDGDVVGLGVSAWSVVVDDAGAEWEIVGTPVVRTDVTGLPWSTCTLRRYGDQGTGVS